MILDAPADLQPMMTKRPTLPRPKATQVEPRVTCGETSSCNVRPRVKMWNLQSISNIRTQNSEDHYDELLGLDDLFL